MLGSKKLRFRRKLYFKKRSTDSRAVRIKTETNKAGVFKKLSIVFLILVQLASLIFLYTWFSVASKWVLLFNFILSYSIRLKICHTHIRIGNG